MPNVLRPTRRGLMAGGAVLALAAFTDRLRAQENPDADAPEEGAGMPAQPRSFDFDVLTEIARQRAESVDPAPPSMDPVLGALDYDDYQRIAYRPANARWASDHAGWQLQPFHPGWLFNQPVKLHEVSAGAEVPLVFSSDDFEYRSGMKATVPDDFALPDVAGFKLTYPLNRADLQDEVAAFVGSSYFRALGRGSHYGLSARGLAVDAGLPIPEEFPRFSEFWLERPEPAARHLRLWALMDSARLTGAYEFLITPGETTVMEVTARLFFRVAVTELGVAPLTSMFLFGGVNRPAFDDYRPQVHDSDGLRIERADGDVIWRALSNPAEIASSYFAEPGLRRFGLHQRSRGFEDFQDAGARYERRPSLDVEPIGDWGPGTVRLFEIPTRLEVHDNIGAFWVPAGKIEPGTQREFRYRLHWGDLDPDPDGDLAWVADTLSGIGGAAGLDNPPDTRKFVVDFEGGVLGATPEDDPLIRPVVNVRGGTAEIVTLSRLPQGNRWRLVMDIAAASGALVEINAHVAGHGRKLSEIWTFQWKKP
ncbi:glucan biosynthesis protein [Pseudogemmobacter sonorensis]|uniref:glucan biosynthesis protein n=1 Tax=Pseudogemmobacter sonorensis TaxID=2989681 RepID=UPI0036A9DC4C